MKTIWPTVLLILFSIHILASCANQYGNSNHLSACALCPQYDIDINNSSYFELLQLPISITEVTAIDRHLKDGMRFRKPHDFLLVISKESTEKIWPYIIVQPPNRCGSDFDCFALNGGCQTDYFQKFRDSHYASLIWDHKPDLPQK